MTHAGILIWLVGLVALVAATILIISGPKELNSFSIVLSVGGVAATLIGGKLIFNPDRAENSNTDSSASAG